MYKFNFTGFSQLKALVRRPDSLWLTTWKALPGLSRGFLGGDLLPGSCFERSEKLHLSASLQLVGMLTQDLSRARPIIGGGENPSKSGLNPTKRNWTPPEQNQPGVLLRSGVTIIGLVMEVSQLPSTRARGSIPETVNPKHHFGGNLIVSDCSSQSLLAFARLLQAIASKGTRLSNLFISVQARVPASDEPSGEVGVFFVQRLDPLVDIRIRGFMSTSHF